MYINLLSKFFNFSYPGLAGYIHRYLIYTLDGASNYSVIQKLKP